MKKQHSNKGFTIVELLVVIVIIAILAAISIVAYIGMQNKAGISVLTSDLKNASTRLALDNATNDSYPDSEVDANGGKGLPKSLDTAYQYTKNGNSYCLSATSVKYNLSFHISSDSGGVVEEGVCSGHIAAGGEVSLPGWKQVSTGSWHTCGIAADNKAYCWGGSTYWGFPGILGNGSTEAKAVPTAVDTSGVLNGKTIKAISTNSNYEIPPVCVIASDNNAYCWGNNNGGQLGNGSTDNSTVPVAVNNTGVLSGKAIKSISVGGDFVCAIASDDNAYCWGNNSSGQLGNNSTTFSKVPVAVNKTGVLSGKTIKSISAGMYNVCAIASDDNAYCWGNNSYGLLGNNSTNNSKVPVAVNKTGVLSGKTIKSISNGGVSTCAVASDDNAYCWGSNQNGALGNNESTGFDWYSGPYYYSTTPVEVSKDGALSGKTIKSIYANRLSVCAIASDGKVYCWGANETGTIGLPPSDYAVAVPMAIDSSGSLNNKKIRSLSLGHYSSCLIDNDGIAYCTGGMYDYKRPGVLGNNSISGSTTYVPVSPIGTIGIRFTDNDEPTIIND